MGDGTAQKPRALTAWVVGVDQAWLGSTHASMHTDANASWEFRNFCTVSLGVPAAVQRPDGIQGGTPRNRTQRGTGATSRSLSFRQVQLRRSRLASSNRSVSRSVVAPGFCIGNICAGRHAILQKGIGQAGCAEGAAHLARFLLKLTKL